LKYALASILAAMLFTGCSHPILSEFGVRQPANMIGRTVL